MPKQYGKLDLRNMDCMELMKDYPDNHFDLAIVDPPYGIGDFRHNSSRKKHKKIEWNNVTPNAEYFLELERVSKNRIIWGCNYFCGHINDVGRIVHDKTGGQKRQQLKELSDADIASHSFGVNIKLFPFLWQGNATDRKIPFHLMKRYHPCEKPEELYKWLLQNYAKEGDKILDTHLGSGSIAIACYYMGFNLTGSELDPDYYAAMMERIDKETRQQELF